MSKREWTLVFLPLALVWSVDRITKWLAIDITRPVHFWFFDFIYVENHGAMLGLFSELPAVLRIVSLSTGGAFLIFTYAAIQYLLPIKSIPLRAGLSALLGGILGNVFDRILYGYVIDFISMNILGFRTPIFNLADSLQWVGYAMIMWALIRDGELLWPENEQRKKLWINPSFQMKYSMILVAAGIGISLVAGVFSYTYLRVTMIEIVGLNTPILNRFLLPFAITFSIVSLAFSAMLFMLGRYISHRFVGPLFAFERHISRLIAGEYRPFKLRTSDEFKHLEVLAKELENEMIRLKTSEAENDPRDTINQMSFDLDEEPKDSPV